MARTPQHPRRRSTDFNGGGMSDIPQRVSRLETSVDQIHADLAEVKQELSEGFRTISSTLQSSGKTNWSTVAALGVAILALWAAAIAPLHAELDRHERDLRDRHNENVTQAQQMSLLRERDSILDERLRNTREELEQIRDKGSPSMDRRVSILEAKIAVQHAAAN